MALSITPTEIVASGKYQLLVKASHWERVFLGEIAVIQNGFPFDSKLFTHEKGKPLIRIRDISRSWTENNYLGSFDSAFVVKKGDLLIGMDGDFNAALWSGEDGLLNQRVCRVLINSEYFSNKYLFICLQPYLDAINAETSSVTVKHLSSRTIAEIPLPLPPLPEQYRIVAKIEELFSELDEGVASLKTAREQLKVYRQSLLKYAFEGKLTAAWRETHRYQLESAEALQQRIAREHAERYREQLAHWETKGKLGPKPKAPKPLPPLTAEELAELPELPAGWGWVKYGDLCSLVRNGISAKPEGDSGTPIFRISAVRPMFFDMADVRYIDNPNGAFDSYCLARGDIVFTRYNGSRHYVGVCAEYRSDEGHLFPDKLVQTRVFSRQLSTSYLEKALNSGASRAFIESKIRTTAGQSGVSGEDIKNIPIPVCSIEEQMEIGQELESKLSEADQLDQTLAATLQQAEALRQSILKKAFSGQLVPQDENDEPAAVLLERIRAERNATPAKGRKTKLVSSLLTNC